jgi:hypothetical protein
VILGLARYDHEQAVARRALLDHHAACRVALLAQARGQILQQRNR